MPAEAISYTYDAVRQPTTTTSSLSSYVTNPPTPRPANPSSTNFDRRQEDLADLLL